MEAAAQTADGALPPLTVTRGEFRRSFLLSGELVALEAVTLAVPNVNIWPLQIRYLADDGSELRTGDLIAEFDNSQLLSQIEEQRGRVIEAAHQLASERAKVATEIAELTFTVEQNRADFEKAQIKAKTPRELLSEREYNEHQLALERAKLKLESAQNQLAAKREAGELAIRLQELACKNAEAELAQTEKRLSSLSLRAPQNGILVLGQTRQEGRQLQLGDSLFTGEAVGRLPNLATLVAEAKLFDVDDGQVTPGMAVLATLDAFPGQVFSGQVAALGRLAQQPDNRSARRFFRLHIHLDDLDPTKMRPGMSIKVQVEGPAQTDVLLVPRQSLDWQETRPALARPRVLLADASWADVVLGPCNANVCVLEQGPAEGTRLGRRGI